MSLDAKELAGSFVSIFSLPEIYFKINEVINDPHSSYGDVAKVINNDTSLSLRLLKITNSSFYGFPEPIDSISHAISIIGTQQLRDLALATTVISTFTGIRGDLVDMNSFWRHSVACGIAARALGVQCRLANVDRLYLIGMLHDVGRLILFENASEQARQITDLYQQREEVLVDVETRVLGFDHAQVGFELLKAWNLPEALGEIILAHHRPLKAKDHRLDAAIVHLADGMVKALELGCSGDFLVPPLESQVWELTGIPANQLQNIWEQIEIQYEETIDIFL